MPRSIFGLLLRKALGAGKPKQLQGGLAGILACLWMAFSLVRTTASGLQNRVTVFLSRWRQMGNLYRSRNVISSSRFLRSRPLLNLLN